MDEKFFFRNREGESVAAILGIPGKPNGHAVILLHCFMCTKHHRIMRNLAECLAISGFAVLRFDFSGNGESKGKVEESTYTKMISEVKDAVSLLKKRGMKKIGVAGHSMGAMLGLLCAHEDPRIDAVAFISGSSQAARVREVFSDEVVEKAEREGSAEAFVYGRDIILKREFLHDLEKYNVGHAVAMLKKPLLIVHGAKDEVIAPFHARSLFGWAHEPKTLELVAGADHLFRRDEDLIRLREIVCGWFGKSLSPQ